MPGLIHVRSLFAAAALLTATAACTQKSETRREADRAAEAVTDKVEELRDESRDLAETAKEKVDDINAIDEVRTPIDTEDTVREVADYVGKKAEIPQKRVVDGVEEIAEEAKDVGETARELERATTDFKYRRMVRIGTLRAVHAVAASQPMLINAFTESFGLVDEDRAKVHEKLVIFQMRLDEAGNAIQSLELVDAPDWEDRSDAATKALERVEDAREDVWEELRDADRIGDRTSMR